MEPSIFTRIIKGEIPSYKIYEDDQTIAFLDLHPLNPGHTLLVPKKQIADILDLPDEDYQNLWAVAKKIARHLKQKTGAPRIGMVVEGFGVPHVHIHLVPIYNGDDLKKPQNLQAEPDHQALVQEAEKLKMEATNA